MISTKFKEGDRVCFYENGDSKHRIDGVVVSKEKAKEFMDNAIGEEYEENYSLHVVAEWQLGDSKEIFAVLESEVTLNRDDGEIICVRRRDKTFMEVFAKFMESL